jgi:hypothetical protein
MTAIRPLRRLPLVLSLAIAACDGDGFGPSERAALDRAEALWQERAPAAYRFDYQYACFCPRIEARITVRGGEIEAVEVLGEAGHDPGHPWPTIDSLFVRLRRTTRDLDDGWNVDARYDAELGFPTEINSTGPENVADAGSIERVTNLVVLP